MSPELEAAIAALLAAIRAEVRKAIAEEMAKIEPRLFVDGPAKPPPDPQGG